jgi:hypothetical protein
MSDHRNWGITKSVYIPPPPRMKIRHWIWDTIAAMLGIITIGIMILVIAAIVGTV